MAHLAPYPFAALARRMFRELERTGAVFDLPLSAPELLEGQTVLIGSSRRMPSAAGTIFHVKEPILKTMAVQASYVVERRRRVE